MHLAVTLSRRTFLSLITILVSIVLLIFIVSSTLTQTVLNRQQLKQWIGGENSYELVESTLRESLAEQTTLEETTAATKQTEQLIDLTVKYFDQSKLNTVSDKLIDGIFNWLDGEQDIEFEIRLFDSKQQLKDFFVESQYLRIQSLDKCTEQQLSELDRVDLFNIQCQPSSVSAQQLRTQLDKASTQQIDELYRSTTISGEDLELNDTSSDVDRVRDVYQLIKALPLISLIITGLILTMALLVLRDWRGWLSYSGWVLIGLPLLVFVGGLLLWHLEGLRVDAFETINADNIDPQLLRAATEPVVVNLSRTLTLQSLWVMVTGLMALGAAKWRQINDFVRSKFDRVEG